MPPSSVALSFKFIMTFPTSLVVVGCRNKDMLESDLTIKASASLISAASFEPIVAKKY